MFFSSVNSSHSAVLLRASVVDADEVVVRNTVQSYRSRPLDFHDYHHHQLAESPKIAKSPSHSRLLEAFQRRATAAVRLGFPTATSMR